MLCGGLFSEFALWYAQHQLPSSADTAFGTVVSCRWCVKRTFLFAHFVGISSTPLSAA